MHLNSWERAHRVVADISQLLARHVQRFSPPAKTILHLPAMLTLLWMTPPT